MVYITGNILGSLSVESSLKSGSGFFVASLNDAGLGKDIAGHR
jgi:hypothetical protein